MVAPHGLNGAYRDVDDPETTERAAAGTSVSEKAGWAIKTARAVELGRQVFRRRLLGVGTVSSGSVSAAVSGAISGATRYTVRVHSAVSPAAFDRILAQIDASDEHRHSLSRTVLRAQPHLLVAPAEELLLEHEAQHGHL